MAGRDDKSRSDPARLTVTVDGYVQGVGFRWFVQRIASAAGLAGSASNLPNGSVEVVVEGPRAACEELLETLRGGRAPGQVREVAVAWSSPTGMSGFRTR
jgi:acylphosphatase